MAYNGELGFVALAVVWELYWSSVKFVNLAKTSRQELLNVQKGRTRRSLSWRDIDVMVTPLTRKASASDTSGD